MRVHSLFVVGWLLCCGFVAGCISPGVTKMAKQPPKPSQDEFSCGEPTPPRLKTAQLQQSYQAATHAQVPKAE